METLGRARRLAGAVAAATLLTAATSCGPRVDVKQALQVTDVTTGWFDAGIVSGKNKLVPSISFRLKNASAVELASVQINVIFEIPPDWEDDTYMRGVGSDGLPAGAASDRFVVRAKHGFTGEQPRAELLQHSQFKDARVKVQVKHASSQWVQLGEFPVERQLLTN
jgi:hypothetical protein